MSFILNRQTLKKSPQEIASLTRQLANSSKVSQGGHNHDGTSCSKGIEFTIDTAQATNYLGFDVTNQQHSDINYNLKDWKTFGDNLLRVRQFPQEVGKILKTIIST